MSCYFLREMHNAMTHIVKIILWDFLMTCLSYSMWVSHVLWPTKYERGVLWDVLMRYFLPCMMVLCNLNGVFLTCYLLSNTWCFLWVFWDFSFLWFEKNLRYYTFYYITFAIWCGNNVLGGLSKIISECLKYKFYSISSITLSLLCIDDRDVNSAPQFANIIFEVHP